MSTHSNISPKVSAEIITDDERLLSKMTRALMAYYGPITLIRVVLIEADRVIEDMAVNGYIEQAKDFARVMSEIRKVL